MIIIDSALALDYITGSRSLSAGFGASVVDEQPSSAAAPPHGTYPDEPNERLGGRDIG